MKRLLILAFLPISLIVGCSKSNIGPNPELSTLVNTKWEAYKTTGEDGTKYMDRLAFISIDKVEYFITHGPQMKITSRGKSLLNYTFDGNKLRIHGIINTSDGVVGNGDRVEYNMIYSPKAGGHAPTLSGSGFNYIQY